MKRTGKSTQIRIKQKDKEEWDKYCEALNKSSPELFNKILSSEKLDIQRRIIEEYHKKSKEIERRFG